MKKVFLVFVMMAFFGCAKEEVKPIDEGININVQMAIPPSDKPKGDAPKK